MDNQKIRSGLWTGRIPADDQSNLSSISNNSKSESPKRQDPNLSDSIVHQAAFEPPEPDSTPNPDNTVLFSHPAEQAFLGCLFSEYNQVGSSLAAFDFHDLRHQVIYRAMQDLMEEGVIFTLSILQDRLESTGKLAAAGGPAYLAAIVAAPETTLAIDGYTGIIREFSRKRQAKTALERIAQDIEAGKTLEPGDLDRLALLCGDPHKDGRFTLHWASEAFQDQPPTEWIVENIIPSGSVFILFGEGGDYKTWTSLDLAMCVAQGENFLGFPTLQGTVLIVDEESGKRRLNKRLNKCMRGHYAGEDIPVAYTSLDQFNFRDINDLNKLQALIIETGAKLVIVDALADIMPGADENLVKDVQPIFLGLRRIADATGSAIGILHHANKMGGYRGSSALKGAVDLLLIIKATGKVLSFKIEKSRDAEPISFTAIANFSEGQFWLTAADNLPPKLSKSQKYVLRYLSENGSSLLADIMAKADTCSGGAARTALYTLTDQGLTKRMDSGGPGSKATYDMTPEGQKLARENGFIEPPPVPEL